MRARSLIRRINTRVFGVYTPKTSGYGSSEGRRVVGRGLEIIQRVLVEGSVAVVVLDEVVVVVVEQFFSTDMLRFDSVVGNIGNIGNIAVVIIVVVANVSNKIEVKPRLGGR